MLHKDTLDRAAVYPNFWECAVQTFNDRDKDEKSQAVIVNMTEENLEKCVKLQSIKPYGIFFSVNPMESGKRNKESVKMIQTWICDIDTGTKEEQLELINKAPLKPSLVVESVHGFHLYYLSQGEITEQQFINGNTGLVRYYHGDVKVIKDTARVLRIPGYLHLKGEPQLVKYRDDLSNGEHYTMEQMQVAFYCEEEKPQPREIKRIEKQRDGGDSYREKVNSLDNKQMLYELSGTRFVDGEIIDFRPCSTGEQIRCNGKSTSCRIDRNGMIGSSDKGGPTWIQWASRHADKKGQNLDFKELAQWLNANHPELEGKKKFKISDIEKKETDEDVIGFVYPSDVFNDFECFMSGELVTIVAETNSGKTTFAMDLIKKNGDLGKKGCYINLEFNIENVWKDKWMWVHGKTKANLTDLNPMTEDEKKEMNYYVKQNMKAFDSRSSPSGISLESLEELIYNKSQEGYKLFVVDSFSKIHGNLDGKNARGHQNRCMEELQDLVQKLNIAVVVLHHTNKNGEFEGTQKIADLSNVFILIQKDTNSFGDEYRKYILSKDKFVHSREIKAVYRMGKYETFNG